MSKKYEVYVYTKYLIAVRDDAKLNKFSIVDSNGPKQSKTVTSEVFARTSKMRKCYNHFCPVAQCLQRLKTIIMRRLWRNLGDDGKVLNYARMRDGLR